MRLLGLRLILSWCKRGNALIELLFRSVYVFAKWPYNQLSGKVKPNCLKSRVIGKVGYPAD